jgi:hypothetical protein
MTRKALARRIAESYLTSQQGGEAPAPPQPEGLRGFWPGALLLVSQNHSGYSPSSRRAPSQNSQQRCYTSLRLAALGFWLVASSLSAFLFVQKIDASLLEATCVEGVFKQSLNCYKLVTITGLLSRQRNPVAMDRQYVRRRIHRTRRKQ